MSKLKVVRVPGQSMSPQHLVALLIAHHLIIGFIQGDPHLYVGPQFSVTEPGIVGKGLWGLSEEKNMVLNNNYGCFEKSYKLILNGFL